MSSRFLVTLAVFLLLGAAVVGYWGLQQTTTRSDTTTPLSSAPPPPSEQISLQAQEIRRQAEDELLAPVVVLARNIAAHTPLTEEDLFEERLKVAPPGSYPDASVLLNKTLWRDLAAGTVLTESSFEVGGPLARMIRPNERALAISIDEVVSNGGHLRPGDYVDVLLYLDQDETNSDQTAQVIVPSLRLLSVGAELGLTLSGEPAAPAATTEEEQRALAQQRAQRSSARTAVLAVPEALVTRFTLATQVGRLQLAVRSSEEKLLESFYAGTLEQSDTINQQLFQFQKLAVNQAQRPQPGLVPPPPRGIEVRRGTSVARELP